MVKSTVHRTLTLKTLKLAASSFARLDAAFLCLEKMGRLAEFRCSEYDRGLPVTTSSS